MTNKNQAQLTLSAPAELHEQKTAKTLAAVEPLDPKQPNLATIATTFNTSIDSVGLVCCLTTMLFFAAPLSNLVSDILKPNIIYVYKSCKHIHIL